MQPEGHSPKIPFLLQLCNIKELYREQQAEHAAWAFLQSLQIEEGERKKPEGKLEKQSSKLKKMSKIFKAIQYKLLLL